jgi:hypothetical protein
MEVPALSCVTAQGPAENKQRRGYGPVVFRLQSLPPFLYIIAVFGCAAALDGGGKRCRAYRYAQDIPIDECLLSLQTQTPELAGTQQALFAQGAVVVGGVDAPARTDQKNPATVSRLPLGRQTDGFGVAWFLEAVENEVGGINKQIVGVLDVGVRWTGFSGQAPSLTSEAGYRP